MGIREASAMKQRFAIETDIAAGRIQDRPFMGADFLLRRGQLSQRRLKRAERAQRSQLEKAAKATDELGYESLRAGGAAKLTTANWISVKRLV
jgi:hypothetical protein